MVELTRTVRFACGQGLADGNGYSGAPALRDWERIEELEVTCRGEVQAETAYLIDIKTVDGAVRRAAVPTFARAKDAGRSGPGVMAEVWTHLAEPLRSSGVQLVRVRWNRSPYDSIEMTAASPCSVLYRQRFDFAAAHRLHNPALSDAENQRLYGKCNNPRGHGHNYQFEPCIEVPVGAPEFSTAGVERLCQRHLLDRFDHKNLNEDTVEFGSPAGVNPSVENIARVFFELLAEPVAREMPGCALRTMTVWETDRTAATYPA